MVEATDGSNHLVFRWENKWLDQISNKDATILYCLANRVKVDYAKLIWEDIIHKLNKKTREKVVPCPSFFPFHSVSASGHDASEESIAEDDLRLSARNDSIPSQQDKSEEDETKKSKDTHATSHNIPEDTLVSHPSSLKSAQIQELMAQELSVELLDLPSQISSIHEKLKTLDSLPSILNKVTDTLNRFATMVENASRAAQWSFESPVLFLFLLANSFSSFRGYYSLRGLLKSILILFQFDQGEEVALPAKGTLLRAALDAFSTIVANLFKNGHLSHQFFSFSC
nr:hypothetical protein [Tanacetum cinerariifolium]